MASMVRPTPPVPSSIHPRPCGRRRRASQRHAFLEDNDAYTFFEALGDLIHTGPTGTNVGDLQVILLA